MIPLSVDAATTADDAADYLVQMHREGCIDLHAHPDLSAFVREFFGGFERDGMDVADDQHSERADQEAWT